MEAGTNRRAVAAAFGLAFLCLGGLWIEIPGIQNDEAMFASVLFEPKIEAVHIRYFGFRIPAMSFPYIGTVKTVIYALLFRGIDPSPESIRWPALLLGAWSVYLFCRLMQRATDLRTANVATALLVADAAYLFTIRCDWGPVAVQHVCAIGGVYCWVLGRPWQKFLGGLCFGLGLWDKLTFLWILAALAAGAAAARFLPKGRAALCGLAGFLIGCYPFLAYNYKTGLASFEAARRQQLALGEVPEKARLLGRTLSGVPLLGSLAMNDGPNAPELDAAASAVVRLSEWTGGWRESWLPWLVLGGAALGWRSAHRRVYRFAVAALAAGFLAMTAQASSGGSPHHHVLLWPLPHVLAAVVPWPRVVPALVLATQLLVVNQHYAQWVRFGGDSAWTDAVYPLTRTLRESGEPYRIIDWGIYDAVYLLSRGQVKMSYSVPPESEDWSAFQPTFPF
ncbi:MAG: hypothetical protein FJW30_25120 [Acidobacteria bacterium]|nr:hypothetical protein [Acidobacteriota bacterium]